MADSLLGYMHGTSPAEQQRLARLNLSLNDLSLRELALEGGERVIDFGSGLGQLTRLMARAAGPAGRVIGFDNSDAQLARARELAAADDESGLVEFRRGEVADPPLTPGEWGTFDVAHARFVVEHVTDPLAVVRQMVRAVRPGGRIVLEDDDHDALRTWPEPPGFAALWQTYIQVIATNRNDPFVGRRLPALLDAAGAAPSRVSGIFYGGAGRTDALRTAIENIVGLFDGVRDVMLRVSLLSEADYRDTVRALRAWGERPDAALWYSFAWAEGIRVR